MDEQDTILIVDDDIQSLKTLSDILVAEGYRVRPADSGILALQSLERNIPELILLDIDMPEIDGFEVCKKIKSDERFAGIPVIFVSVFEDVERRVKGLNIGAVDYVAKPYHPKELLVRVRNHINLFKLQKQLTEKTIELTALNNQLTNEINNHKKTMKSLEESECRFSALVEVSPLGIITFTASGDCVYVNDSAAKIIGTEKNNILTSNFNSIKSWQKSDLLQNALTALKSQEIISHEAHYTSEFGKEVWTQLFHVPFLVNDKKYLLLMIQDIKEKKLMEEVFLRESENKYQSLVEKSNAMICEIDSEGKLLYVNSIYKDILGYKPSEMIGKYAFDFGSPEEEDYAKRRLKETSELDVSQKNIWKFKDIWNNWHWFCCYSNSFIDKNGKKRISVVSFDITERKEMEKLLQEREANLNAILENTDDLICLRDTKNRLVFYNNAFAKIIKKLFNAEVFTGMNTLELLPDSIRKNWETIIFKVLSGERYHGEFSWDFGNGDIRNYEISFNPVFKGKSIIGYSEFNHDITKRKWMEATLKESEEKFSKVFYFTPTMMTISELPEGRYTDINDEFIRATGYSKEDAIGKTSVELGLILPEDREAIKNLYLTDGFIKNREMVLYSKDKKKIFCLYSGAIVSKGEKTQILTNSIDITARKEAENALKESQELFFKVFHTNPASVLISKVSDGKIVDVNDSFCKMIGLNREEIIGKTTPELKIIPPEEKEAYLKEIKETGILKNIENNFINNKGLEVSLLISAVLVNLNKIPHLLTVTLDITNRKLIEKQLEKNNECLRLALSAAKAGYWDWDILNNTFDWSEELLDVFGIEKNTAPGFVSWERSVHPEDREIASKKIQESIDQKIDLVNDYRIITKNGSIRWIRAMGKTHYEKDKAIRMIGLCIDITEQFKAEKELKENERMFNTLIQNLPGFVYRCKNDQDWTMIYISDGCLQVTGYGPSELINNKIISYNNLIVPEYRDNMWETWQNGLNINAWFEDEYPISEKGGKIKWVWERGRGVYDDEGKLLYLEGYIEDINESKLAEKKIKESEEKFSTVFYNAPVIMSLSNIENGQLIDVNEKLVQISGYAKEELIGKTTVELGWFSGTDRSKIVEELTKNEFIQERDLVVFSKDGKQVQTMLSGSVINIGGQKLLLASAVDISERRTAEALLRESEKKFRKLFENMLEGFIYCKILYNNVEPVDIVILETNDKFTEFTEFSNVIGKNVSEILPGFFNDEIEIIKMCDRVVTSGTPARREYFMKSLSKWFSISLFSPEKEHIVAIFDLIDDRKKSEELLRIKQEQLDLAIGSANMGIWEWDLFNEIGYLDAKASEIIGLNSGATNISTEEYFKIVHPEDRWKIEAAMSNAVVNDTLYEPEYRIIWPDGSIHFITSRAQFTSKDGKKINRMNGVIWDETQRVIMEEKLKESGYFLQRILDSTPNLIHIFDITQKKNIFSNNEVLLFLGYTQTEIRDMGVSYLDVLLHPDDLQKVRQHFELFKTSNESQVYEIEYRMKHADGQWRWYRNKDILFARDLDNNILQILGSAEDITERKKTREELIKSEERYYTLFNFAAVPIWEEDLSEYKKYLDNLMEIGISDFRKYFDDNPDEVKYCASLMKIIDVSSESLSFFNVVSKEEIIGYLPAYFVEESWEGFKEELIQLAEGKDEFQIEIPILDLKCQRKDIIIRGRILPEFISTMSRVLVSFVDISAIKLFEKEMLLEKRRISSQLNISQINTDSPDDLLIAILEESKKIMDSDSGFIGLYNKVTQELEMHSCSEILLEEFSIPSTPILNIKDLNVLSEPIIQKKPVIVNDFKTIYLAKRLKTLVHRLLLLPIKSGDTILAVIGVANKKSDYTETDEHQLSLFIDEAWKIFERKKIQILLTQSEKSLKRSQEIAHIGHWTWDIKKNVVLCSDEAFYLLGINKDKFTGTWDYINQTAIYPEDRKSFQTAHMNIIQNAENTGFEYRVIWPDTSLHILMTQPGDRFYDENQNLIYLSGIVQDITERKKTETEMIKLNDQLRALSLHLEKIREEERTRIAREIHDELGQSLTGIKIDITWLANRLTDHKIDTIQMLEKFHSIICLIDSTITSVRRISTGLRPGVLDYLGLPAAIEWQADEFTTRTGIECICKIYPKDLDMDPERITGLFRIFQESLTNIMRHAKATKVEVALEIIDDFLILTVQDDGIGISQMSIDDTKSLGLLGIRERVKHMNGKFEISGIPNTGTTLCIKVPIRKEN